MNEYLDKGIELTVKHTPNVLLAIVVLLVGLALINGFVRSMGKLMKSRGVDDSLQPFFRSLLSILLKALLGLSVLSMLGVEVTSFIAILGAAGLAVGLALSGTLQNFAGGVMILLFRPFKVGDFVDAMGYMGTISEIQIFNTILKTPDNKTIIIPNGGLSSSSLTNFSREPQRRVDWTFGIGYGDNIGQARGVLQGLLDADERILKDPATFIGVSELGDSSVNFAVRAWVNGADYWGVFFDMNEKVYDAFNAAGLNIPYPQMDVHLHQTS